MYGAHAADPVLTGEDDAVAATGWGANYDDEEVMMLEKEDYDEEDEDEDEVVSRTSSSGLSSSGFSGSEDEGGRGGGSPDLNIHDQDLADFLLEDRKSVV